MWMFGLAWYTSPQDPTRMPIRPSTASSRTSMLDLVHPELTAAPTSFRLPRLLEAAHPATYDGRTAHRQRLLAGLVFWAKQGWALAEDAYDKPALLPAIEMTRTSLLRDEVVLCDGDTPTAWLEAQLLLDANVAFAKVLGFRRSWQLREPGTWDEWERVVAWAEESHDPNGGEFDLPAQWREIGEPDLPLFGWRLDLTWGAPVGRHDVPEVRLIHPSTLQRRRLPVFDALRCFRRGQTAMERLRSRPVRLEGAWQAATLVSLSFTDGRAVVERPDRKRAGETEQIEVSLRGLARRNRDVVPLLKAARSDEILAIRRAMETHQAAEGEWVAPSALRDATERPRLPLTGWTLAENAFDDLTRGEIRLAHRLDDDLVVSAREALTMMQQDVPAWARLLDDPSRTPEGGAGFVRDWDANYFRMTPGPSDSLDGAIEVPHVAWLEANEALLPAVLEVIPHLGVMSEATGLRGWLAERLPGPHRCLEPIRDILVAPAPRLDHATHRAHLMEFLANPPGDVEFTWTDRDGVHWLPVGATEAGTLRCAAVEAWWDLPMIAPRDGEPEGQLWIARDRPSRKARELTPDQLVFAHRALAAALVAHQTAADHLGRSREPLHFEDRVSHVVHRVQRALSARMQQAKRHMALSGELHEDPKKARSMNAYLGRLETNREEAYTGKLLQIRLAEERTSTVGVGLALGGVARVAKRAGDDRIVITDAITSRFLGRFRLVTVGGGDSFQSEATGPRITRLLERIERNVARDIANAVDLDEVEQLARDAVLASSREDEQDLPYCSLTLALTHLDSGETLLLWSGNARAFAFHPRSDRLYAVTWDHSLHGFFDLARHAGLSEANALYLVLMYVLQRGSERSLTHVPDAELAEGAEVVNSEGRRHAIRAGLGGATAQMLMVHEQLLQLFQVFEKAIGRPLDLEPLHRGASMLFRRRLPASNGRRLILATDGAVNIIEEDPLATLRALRLPDPQRAVERLLPDDDQPPEDDVAMVILDGPAPAPLRQTHVRLRGKLYQLTPDQTGLLNGAVVLPIGDVEAQPIRVDGKKLGRFFGELDDLRRVGGVPDPIANPRGFVEAVARYVTGRKKEQRPERVKPEDFKDLHNAFDAGDADPRDETLVMVFLLRRKGLPARYVSGVRVQRTPVGRRVADTCWLEVDLPGTTLAVDLGLGRRAIFERDRAYGAGAQLGGLRGLGGAITVRLLPFPFTMVAVPVELPTPHEDEYEPTERLRTLREKTSRSRAAEARRTAASSPSSAEAGEGDGELGEEDDSSEEFETDETTGDDGWLNLDF